MTIQESTICGLIQTFPVLIILAQNNNKCLKTPFVYKPPSPTQSPEYYEALDALFQTLYGHDSHGLHQGYGNPNDYPNNYGSSNVYGNSYSYVNSHSHPAQYYPCIQNVHVKKWQQSPSKPCYQYVNTGYLGNPSYGNVGYTHQSYPSYGYKRSGNLYQNASGNQIYATKSYAPDQVYTTTNKNKVIVKKTRIGGRRKSEKLRGFFPRHEERAFTPFQLGQALIPNVNRFQERINNLFKSRPETNRPSVVNDQLNNQFQQPNNQFQQINNLFQQPNNQFQQPNNPSGTDQNQFYNNGQNYNGAVMFPSQYDQSAFAQENQPINNSPNQVNSPVDQQYQNNNRPVVFPTPPSMETNPSQNNYNQQSQLNQNGTPEANQSNPEKNSNQDQVNSGANPDQTVYETTQVNQVEHGNGYTQGQDSFNQGQDNLNQGQDNLNQGQNNFNQGQTTQGNFITTEATTYSEVQTSTETTTLAPLTPVPNFESRNFNFGPSGIFAETCQTVENEIGSCIPLGQCEPYWNMLKELKNDPSIVNLLRRAHCGFEGKNPKVCCPRPGLPTSGPETTSTSTTSTTTTTTTTTTPTPVPEPSGKSLPEDFVPSFPEPPVCGISNASFSRVVGGVDAKLNDFPWIAAIGYKPRRNSGTRWLCGGSLISSKHVLTAAHCIHNLEDQLYVVRLGELNLARDDDGAFPIDVLIKYKIKHEDYNATAYTNDIGILVLDKEVEFTDMIKPICIPKDTELRARSYENYNPLIAGWGDTDFRGPSSDHLQVLQLPVVSNDFCKEAYVKFKNQKIDERVLCAGFKKGGRDACQGDSGGPLMQPIYDQKEFKTYFYQIGVVSFGKKCAEAGFPGVYSRVTHFVPWIQSKVIGN